MCDAGRAGALPLPAFRRIPTALREFLRIPETRSERSRCNGLSTRSRHQKAATPRMKIPPLKMTIKTKPNQILQMLIVTICATLGISSICSGETLHVNRNKVVADVAPTIARMAKDRQLKAGLNLAYVDRQTGTGIFAETYNNK